MNVMHVHADPATAATMLPDQHVNKMATEAAQIVATVADLRGVWHPNLYRPTHRRHPCVVLAATDDRALHWLLRHGLALVDEHRWRHRRHVHDRAEEVLLDAADLLGIWHDDPGRWDGAPVAQAVPDDLRGPDDLLAYRAHLHRKAHAWAAAGRPARYTRRQPPDWLGNALALVQVLP
jgi:hypothetical protein